MCIASSSEMNRQKGLPNVILEMKLIRSKVKVDESGITIVAQIRPTHQWSCYSMLYVRAVASSACVKRKWVCNLVICYTKGSKWQHKSCCSVQSIFKWDEFAKRMTELHIGYEVDPKQCQSRRVRYNNCCTDSANTTMVLLLDAICEGSWLVCLCEKEMVV